MAEQIIEPTQQPTEPTNEPEKIVIKKASKPRAKTPKAIFSKRGRTAKY